ncbi:MAG: hypothetical protein NT023_01680 [Armatimonadetes bacterium]|nr:hypothetical protein [Armatimonadota bacterium]
MHCRLACDGGGKRSSNIAIRDPPASNCTGCRVSITIRSAV